MIFLFFDPENPGGILIFSNLEPADRPTGLEFGILFLLEFETPHS